MDTYFISRWKSQIKKGLLEYIIMLILKTKPCYGYELIADINRLAGMEIAEGTIYPLLNRLKKENLLKSEWIEKEVGIPRKYYQLTPEGIEQLKVMQNYMESLNESITQLMNIK
ncbi:PadR family transcriptional regulator [Sunxiuqinia elliptica]|uniref:PadR family transcriptional regulator n=1 Tax=Sunxiuqinia elliptica TaxID=655355 RepID=A0A1I2G568_9BACT|nr:PadR family transcriptional regulator [Sunxiuqinia elliptica]TDO05520.1 PadR family transcriptional regulator [Sunxiuqinia elliptica]TDO65066.1 PadR family transcriptional regulator [Sunxiuqinia elliptica]SFF12785.1 PadR family transcriptional regulator, regulatory protein PadR [Sunxiuqinia elliptica]